jgi:hypothetical protein
MNENKSLKELIGYEPNQRQERREHASQAAIHGLVRNMTVKIHTRGPAGGSSRVVIELQLPDGINANIVGNRVIFETHGDDEANVLCRANRAVSDLLEYHGFGPADIWNK